MGTCALFFGLAPALRIDIVRAQRWLRTDGRGQTASRERRRLQHALVTCQVAAALVLLFGAGLLLRSFWKLTAVDPGVNTENVVTFQVSLPERRFSADAQVWAFYDRFLERLATISGVRETAAMSGRLPERRANNTTFFLEGVPVEGHKGLPQVEYIQHVTAAYFSALRIPLLRGRTFGVTDTDTGQPVTIVNETLARKFWPGRDPIGQRLRPAIPGTPWFTVVGVVADVKHAGIAAPTGTEVYVAYRQARLILPSWLPTSLHVVLRADANRVRAVQQELPSLARSVEASAALANIRLLEESMNLSIAGPRFLAGLLGAFAAIALLLASVGIYGVVAYGVNQRTTEFGVRTALGASAASIVRLVLAQAALPIAVGVALGFGGVFAAARLITSFLFQTTPLDPATIAAAVALLTSIALAACWIPARRAACVDPLIALRDR
jgi:predicted permease